MGLIRKIEVRYFRSIYRVSLKTEDLNILSGRNDAGKSNILKALNLFFNHSTDWGERFNFSQDFCVRRLEEVRRDTIKGKQYVRIDIEFNRPKNYAGSLPPRFKVHKTWLRDGSVTEANNLETLVRAGKLPSTLEIARRFLAAFLNRVHFEYVPAVKERAYFQHLLNRLQATLLEKPIQSDSEIGSVADRLAQHVEGQIGRLKEDFENATGLETTIVPPAELSALFRAFNVSTSYGEGVVPLILRGDGIQARYVPSVLHYISSESSDFFIWGFEEPENSLEYKYAEALADDFAATYSPEAQIFVTTHSPAFLSLESKQSRCFRVYRQDDSTEISPASGRGVSKHSDELREELGMLQIQKEVHEEYKERMEEHERVLGRVAELEDEMVQLSKPVLLVEGVHDKTILEIAWDKRNPKQDCPFFIRVADSREGVDGGAAGAASVRSMLEAVHPQDERIGIGLFDRDREGLAAYSKLSKNFKEAGEFPGKRHKSGWAYGLLLPIPSGREQYAEAENLCLEFYFSDDLIAQTDESGRGLQLKDPEMHVIVEGRKVDVEGIGQLTLPRLGPYRKLSGGKDVFARRLVPSFSSEAFEAFDPLFSIILSIID